MNKKLLFGLFALAFAVFAFDVASAYGYSAYDYGDYFDTYYAGRIPGNKLSHYFEYGSVWQRVDVSYLDYRSSWGNNYYRNTLPYEVDVLYRHHDDLHGGYQLPQVRCPYHGRCSGY